MNNDVMNCFTVDVEGFVESNVQSFPISAKYYDKNKENYEIEENTNCILNVLSEMDIKGTFFFLGRIARDIPHLVKQVAKFGHEIACHNYEHIRVFGVSKDEFKNKLEYAKKHLEDLAGERVYGFRAPDFSITNASMWALDVLKELGFIYDSSIYPTSLHDVYGIKGIDPLVHRLQNGLIEFPLASIEILNKSVPFGGGGYFRLYPLFVTKRCIASRNKLGDPCMFYIHPYEVGPVIPRITEISSYRKFRHYYNCNKGSRRIKNILQSFKFTSVIEVLKRKNFLEGY